MKKVIKFILLITIMICFSCEKQGFIVKCSDCTEEEPLKATLQIKIDINYNGFPTEINIYEGNLEDSILYKTVQAGGTDASIQVRMNKKYTITASYYIPDDSYVAVNSVYPRVRYDKDQCDNPCYYVYDNKADLRIKYY